jgi:hypothetical protein
MTDPDIRREEELNRRQAERIEDARTGDDDDDGIIDTVEDAFGTLVNPLTRRDDLDPEEAREQAIRNDQAARES